MPLPKSVWIIKGAPGGPDGKWAEVEAIQHEPFIFVQYNGWCITSETLEGEVPLLLDMMTRYKLDPERSHYSPDVCRGVHNPRFINQATTPDQAEYIDGPRMYAADGVWRFAGNFEDYSHAFGIDTNHGPTIAALKAAMDANMARTWESVT